MRFSVCIEYVVCMSDDVDSTQFDIPRLLTEFAQAAGLPPSLADALCSIATTKAVSGGTLIVREGGDCDSLYFISSGQVGIDMLVPGRGQVRILSLGPGDIVSWTAAVGGQSATASAVAIGDAILIAIPAEALHRLLSDNHEVGYHFMHWIARKISRRLVATRLQLLDLFAEESG